MTNGAKGAAASRISAEERDVYANASRLVNGTRTPLSLERQRDTRLVRCIRAPQEGETTCAMMERAGVVHAVLSPDGDVFAMGSERWICKLQNGRATLVDLEDSDFAVDAPLTARARQSSGFGQAFAGRGLVTRQVLGALRGNESYKLPTIGDKTAQRILASVDSPQVSVESVVRVMESADPHYVAEQKDVREGLKFGMGMYSEGLALASRALNESENRSDISPSAPSARLTPHANPQPEPGARRRAVDRAPVDFVLEDVLNELGPAKKRRSTFYRCCKPRPAHPPPAPSEAASECMPMARFSCVQRCGSQLTDLQTSGWRRSLPSHRRGSATRAVGDGSRTCPPRRADGTAR